MGGPGTAVLAGERVGTLGIGSAPGRSLLVMAYVIGPVSGCRINPAVTLGAALACVVDLAMVPFYVIGQLVGAAFGALVLFLIANGDDSSTASGNFAANGWAIESPAATRWPRGVALVEMVFTALLGMVVLPTTNRGSSIGMGGLGVGLTLALIHLVSIPVDNTSVNPARKPWRRAVRDQRRLGADLGVHRLPVDRCGRRGRGVARPQRSGSRTPCSA